MKVRPTTTTVVVDAGEEPWSRVEPLLARRVAELEGEGVVEVHTIDAGVCAALPPWSAQLGMTLERTSEPRGVTGFRLLTSPSLPPEEL